VSPDTGWASVSDAVRARSEDLIAFRFSFPLTFPRHPAPLYEGAGDVFRAVSKTVVGLWSTEGSNPSPSVDNRGAIPAQSREHSEHAAAMAGPTPLLAVTLPRSCNPTLWLSGLMPSARVSQPRVGCCTVPRRARWIRSKAGLRNGPSRSSRATRTSRRGTAQPLWTPLPRAGSALFGDGFVRQPPWKAVRSARTQTCAARRNP
jgi:hypothetical protein